MPIITGHNAERSVSKSLALLYRRCSRVTSFWAGLSRSYCIACDRCETVGTVDAAPSPGHSIVAPFSRIHHGHRALLFERSFATRRLFALAIPPKCGAKVAATRFASAWAITPRQLELRASKQRGYLLAAREQLPAPAPWALHVGTISIDHKLEPPLSAGSRTDAGAPVAVVSLIILHVPMGAAFVGGVRHIFHGMRWCRPLFLLGV